MAGEYGDTIRSTSLYTADNVADLSKYGATIWCGTTSGGGNAYTATSSPTFTAAIAGTRVRAIANFTNAAGSLTFNPNSIGAVRVYMPGATYNPPAGAIVSGEPFELEYNGTNWIFVDRGSEPKTWTPTLGTQAGTYTGTTIRVAAYQRQQGTIYAVQLEVTGTQGASNSNYLTFTLQYASRNLSYDQYVPIYCVDASGEWGLGIVKNNSTTVWVYRFGSAQWTTGAARTYLANFIYDAA